MSRCNYCIHAILFPSGETLRLAYKPAWIACRRGIDQMEDSTALKPFDAITNTVCILIFRVNMIVMTLSPPSLVLREVSPHNKDFVQKSTCHPLRDLPKRGRIHFEWVLPIGILETSPWRHKEWGRRPCGLLNVQLPVLKTREVESSSMHKEATPRPPLSIYAPAFWSPCH